MHNSLHLNMKSGFFSILKPLPLEQIVMIDSAHQFRTAEMLLYFSVQNPSHDYT